MKDLYVPYKLRLTLYVIGFVGTPVVGVLVSQGIAPAITAQIWAAYVTGVSALAAANVTPEYK
jgi:uncharacterized membrane protein (DUF485 family)